MLNTLTKLVDTKYDSLELIKNSLFIATITGSVAIEASILGKKSLAFGKPWYMGCPNTFIWDGDITYNQLIHSPLEPISNVFDFLKNLKVYKNTENTMNFS